MLRKLQPPFPNAGGPRLSRPSFRRGGERIPRQIHIICRFSVRYRGGRASEGFREWSCRPSTTAQCGRPIPQQVRVPLSCAVRSSWQFYRIRFEVKLSYSYRKRNVLNGPRNRRAWRIHLTAGDSHSVPDRRIEEARRICRERRESGTIVNRNRKRARHICRTHGDAASSRVNNSSSGLKIRCKEAHDTYCNM